MNIVAPENLNVLFPRLSFALGMCRSSFHLVAASDSAQHPDPVLSRDLSVTMQGCKNDFEPQMLMACGIIACCAIAFANN